MVTLERALSKVSGLAGGALKGTFEVKAPELLQDDNRRRVRCYVIGLWGLAFSFKMWQDVPAFGFDWYTVAALLLGCQVLACFAYGRPASYKVDVALVTLWWAVYRKRTEILSRPEQFTGEIRGAHIVASFAGFQSILILSGTHQGLILIWTALVYNTCWLTDEPVVHETFILITVLAHFVVGILQYEEAQKRVEKQLAEERRLSQAHTEERHRVEQAHTEERHRVEQAHAEDKHRLELERATAEEKKQRIEYSLNLVLQQLKSPLLLLVSDLKNADRSPELAQLTVRMLAARVSQIWELFTGLALQVEQEVKAVRAREAEGADEPDSGAAAARGAAEEEPTAETPTPPTQSGMPGPTSSSVARPQVPVPQPGPAQPGPRSAASRSSRASSRAGEEMRLPLPSVRSLRVVFDAMHERGKMRELTLFFEDQAEQPFGLLDWVQKEHSSRVSDWIQDEVNKAVAGRVQGRESHTENAVINGVRLSLPWSAENASFEATSLTLRSLTCDVAEEQPSTLSEANVQGSSGGRKKDRDGGCSEASLEGQDANSEKDAEGSEEEKEEEKEEGKEEEENSEEEDEESEDEFDIDSITGVTGVLELTGILPSAVPQQLSRSRRAVWARSLRSVSENGNDSP